MGAGHVGIHRGGGGGGDGKVCTGNRPLHHGHARWAV